MSIARLNGQAWGRRVVEDIVRRRMNRAEAWRDVEPVDISDAPAGREPIGWAHGRGTRDVEVLQPVIGLLVLIAVRTDAEVVDLGKVLVFDAGADREVIGEERRPFDSRLHHRVAS